jgi:hypothetical protein
MHIYHLRRLLADRQGATAIMIAIMTALIIGFTSLGAEIVDALMIQRKMQSAADSAAISAANAQVLAGSATGCGSACTEEAYALAAVDGFAVGQGGGCNAATTVYVGTPCDGPHAASTGYVEALIRQPYTPRLAHLLFSGGFVLHGRAVAQIPSSASGGSCTLSLAPTGSGLFMNGNANVNYTNCAISVASNSSSAVSLNGSNDTLSASSLYVGGNYSAGNGTLTMGSPAAACPNANCVSNAPPGLNPYEGLATPSCVNGKVTKGIATPGCYTTNSFNTATSLCPGVYVISGSISLSGKSSLTSLNSDPTASDYDKNFAKDCPGSATTGGVTIFLTGSVSLTGQASLTLTPTTTGTYAGVLLDSATGSFTSCGGNCSTNLTGALVFPSGNIKYNGSGTDKGHSCTQIIASTIEFVGNASLGSDCASIVTNMKSIVQPSTLAE